MTTTCGSKQWRNVRILAAGLVASCAAWHAGAQTFSNTTPIVLMTSAGPGAPYPSIINVSGVAGTIENVQINLRDIECNFLPSVSVLLVGPQGQRVHLMSSRGGNVRQNIEFLSFQDSASQGVPSPASGLIASGTYRPSGNAGAILPAPAPAGPYSTTLAPLVGANPNGNWLLYVATAGGTNGGTPGIDGGWEVVINPPFAPQSFGNAFTYQGYLEDADVPVNGFPSFQFSLWPHPTATTGRIGSVLTQSLGVDNGLFTATLDFGAGAFGSSARWLEIAVRQPGQATFTRLEPRQQIRPTPVAGTALSLSAASALETPLVNVTSSGRVGVGTTTPVTRFHVKNGSAGLPVGEPLYVNNVSPFMIENHTDTVLALVAPAGTRKAVNFLEGETVGGSIALNPASAPAGSLGLEATGSTNADFVLTPAGDVGIGVFDPDTQFHVAGGSAVSLADGTGTCVFGSINSVNLAMDSNTIQARSNGVSNLLRLNRFGGGVSIGDTGAPSASVIFNVGGNAAKPSGGSWAVLSDARMKRNITPASSGTLDTLLSLRGYTFEYTPEALGSRPALPGTHFGLLAQEVEKVFPNWVSEDETGTKYVTEQSTTALMVEALRDLRAEKDRQIAQRDERLRALQEEHAALRARLEALERAVTHTSVSKHDPAPGKP